jgi:hypothetical protein
MQPIDTGQPRHAATARPATSPAMVLMDPTASLKSRSAKTSIQAIRTTMTHRTEPPAQTVPPAQAVRQVLQVTNDSDPAANARVDTLDRVRPGGARRPDLPTGGDLRPSEGGEPTMRIKPLFGRRDHDHDHDHHHRSRRRSHRRSHRHSRRHSRC